MLTKIHNAWRLWRDHLKWHVWDDVLLLVLFIGAPLFFAWFLSQPTQATAQAAPVATPPPVTWHFNPNDGLMHARRPGPTN